MNCEPGLQFANKGQVKNNFLLQHIIMQKSKIFLLSGPSCAGEDSIIGGLRDKLSFELIITTTTREIRPGESQGKPYYFISKEEFRNGINKDEFYEYAKEDRGNFYGVTKKEFERAVNVGKPIIWKVDYQGVLTAKKLFPECIAILIDVDLETVRGRLLKRDNASEEYIKGRLEHARGWYDNKDKFDYVVKNENGKLNEAIEEVEDIIKKYA